VEELGNPGALVIGVGSQDRGDVLGATVAEQAENAAFAVLVGADQQAHQMADVIGRLGGPVRLVSLTSPLTQGRRDRVVAYGSFHPD
jgi:hypothetical protein